MKVKNRTKTYKSTKKKSKNELNNSEAGVKHQNWINLRQTEWYEEIVFFHYKLLYYQANLSYVHWFNYLLEYVSSRTSQHPYLLLFVFPPALSLSLSLSSSLPFNHSRSFSQPFSFLLYLSFSFLLSTYFLTLSISPSLTCAPSTYGLPTIVAFLDPKRRT